MKTSAFPYFMAHSYCSDLMRVVFQHKNIQSSGTMTVLENASYPSLLQLLEQNTMDWVVLTTEIYFSQFGGWKSKQGAGQLSFWWELSPCLVGDCLPAVFFSGLSACVLGEGGREGRRERESVQPLWCSSYKDTNLIVKDPPPLLPRSPIFRCHDIGD